MKFIPNRKRIGAVATVALATTISLVSASAQEHADDHFVGPVDIYTGTLQREAGQLLLNRCDVVGNRYLLDADGGIDALLEQLPAGVGDGTSPVTVSVIGSYFRQGQQDHLRVQEFTDVQLGTSCHLLDVLDGLLGTPPTTAVESGNRD